MKHIFKILFIAVAFLTFNLGFGQGNTNSALDGRITDTSGNPLPGANIVAVHLPTGTVYGAASDFDGFYRIPNMRPGGPYKLTITYVGFSEFTDENIILSLGETKSVNKSLEESANALEEVLVTVDGNSIFNSKNNGAQTTVGRSQVEALPSLTRNLADFVRLTPQAKISGDDVISISGQNNRYNAVYIDGAVNNDVFGLAANGTNGGQTGVSPISLDAIEQFQINVAPFDVKISGFAGGAISAITRSGTNKFEGSTYYLFRNEDLAAKTPPSLVATGDSREKLEDFTAETYGIRLGGPIVKDKLFFFVNYERQENETPQPFDISNYSGDSSLADLNNLRDYVLSNYNYDIGSFDNNTQSLESDKLIAKIDWNINKDHNISLKHSYVKAVQLDANRSSNRTINFYNGSQLFESITNSTSLELSSRFGNKFSNNLVIGYTAVDDDRGFTGSPFPNVQMFDGSGFINFGSEPFSTANVLNQDVFTFTDNFEIYSGAHTITIGTHNEYASSRNVFFGRNFGYYRYNNLNDFLTNQAANRYRIGYSLIGGTGDDSLGAADFSVFQTGIYFQDEVNFSDNFKVTAGLRFDVPFWEAGPENQDFNTRTIPLLEAAGKDLQGSRTGRKVKNTVHVSPRIGFNWDVTGKKETQIRGGLGIFTSRLPLVWPGGIYNNSGTTNGSLDIRGTSNPEMPTFNPDPETQYKDPQPGSGFVGGNIDLFAHDFKLPQTLKMNIAVDQKLPGGVVLSTDFIYNDNITGIKYENINLEGPQFNLTGPDNRPNYGFKRVDNTYNGIYLASNTGAGSSWNFSGTLTKNFTSSFIDLQLQGTYAYGESKVLFDATSSQNSSQWERIETVNGANAVTRTSRSDFSQGHRILGISSFTFKWSENVKTKIGIFYEGLDGAPISYVYSDFGNIMEDTGVNGALIYVPANQSEIKFVGTPQEQQEQWNNLNRFISNNDYLNSKRGDYVERNGDRLKWSHVIDLKFAQEFSINFGETKHALELTADIFNFTNLLNKDWGKRYNDNFNQLALIDFEGFDTDGTTPTFSYDTNAERNLNQIDDSGLQSSRWQMQIGVRYKFN